ncbi:MarR family transcriptional regulator [Legionella dresdenensis]|uniref:MarR family transcriptional regulator n=1 Tax=Legionella dresdenensis TaxID=450200 RepID=A0ABV8CEF9_9GAMM
MISDLKEHIGYWHNRFGQSVGLSFEQKLHQHGVTVSQWCVLIILYHQQAKTMSEVAHHLGIDNGAITRLIDRLVIKELVIKNRHEQDARATCINLTEKGRKLIPLLTDEADRNDYDYFSILSVTELITYKTLLSILLAAQGITVEQDWPARLLKNPDGVTMKQEIINLIHRLSAPIDDSDAQLSFPEVIQQLHEAGITRYYVDLVTGNKIYYHNDGSTYTHAACIKKYAINEHYNESGVIAALRAIQGGKINYPEFLMQICKNGVVNYVVYIEGKRAHYISALGEVYQENFG